MCISLPSTLICKSFAQFFFQNLWTICLHNAFWDVFVKLRRRGLAELGTRVGTFYFSHLWNIFHYILNIYANILDKYHSRFVWYRAEESETHFFRAQINRVWNALQNKRHKTALIGMKLFFFWITTKIKWYISLYRRYKTPERTMRRYEGHVLDALW